MRGVAGDVTQEASAFIAAHRVARLATSDENGAPHVVPVCYIYDGSSIYSAIDLKPKRDPSLRLKRVRNILSNPAVALLIDDYSEDWSDLDMCWSTARPPFLRMAQSETGPSRC